ncbi:hypothetical protein [Paracoccus sp. (in: a-proteobacteria)]|uniref:hypothetical protein n=1 Tax=Paracoccus sp. TaxID=267 RepID=UPI0026DFE51A|nr:hypothetical protein [Paracoccus sp. (in: a-proteobacteria)]MDO5371398.1 hypothetical protein [Paracoccus sp. (in: a-proteobacteria)]
MANGYLKPQPAPRRLKGAATGDPAKPAGKGQNPRPDMVIVAGRPSRACKAIFAFAVSQAVPEVWNGIASRGRLPKSGRVILGTGRSDAIRPLWNSPACRNGTALRRGAAEGDFILATGAA